MASGTENAGLFPSDRMSPDRMDDVGRLIFKVAAEVSLNDIVGRTKNRTILRDVYSAMSYLNYFYEVCELVISRHEAKGNWDRFRLLLRQLAGMAEEIAAMAGRRPDQACNRFKAEQLNRVLVPMKEMIEEDMGVSFPLVSEEGLHSYSDVSLILRGCLDVAAAWARRYYDGNPPVIPSVPADCRTTLIEDSILAFCTDEAKGILEIGNMLGFRDKKTIRKYLKPLIVDGWIVRTVPDKPNSRNQKYLTVRFS